MQIMKFQIGKSGITPGTILSLKNALKRHKIVRVAVLKGAGPEKARVEAMAKQLEQDLDNAVRSRIIGFTIILRRIKMLEEESISKPRKSSK